MALAAVATSSCSSTTSSGTAESAAVAPAPAPAPETDLQGQWKSRIQKSYPQWQPPSAVIPEGNPSYAAPAAPSPAIPEPPGFFANSVPAAVVQEPSASKSYIVKNGDTLWGISKSVYGDGEKWPSIYEANKGKLKNPDKLSPGVELTLPAK